MNSITSARRKFISQSLSVLALGLIHPLVAGAASASTVRSDRKMAMRLIKVFENRDSASAIGKTYLSALETHPHWHDLLVEITSDKFKGLSSPRLNDSGHLNAWLSARIHRDYEKQDVLVVDGWVLSRTETNLCALAALL